MKPKEHDRRWLWITLVLSSVTIVAVTFSVWELIESLFFRDADYITLHYLYITLFAGIFARPASAFRCRNQIVGTAEFVMTMIAFPVALLGVADRDAP